VLTFEKAISTDVVAHAPAFTYALSAAKPSKSWFYESPMHSSVLKRLNSHQLYQRGS
jgi:hypothetical protein